MNFGNSGKIDFSFNRKNCLLSSQEFQVFNVISNPKELMGLDLVVFEFPKIEANIYANIKFHEIVSSPSIYKILKSYEIQNGFQAIGNKFLFTLKEFFSPKKRMISNQEIKNVMVEIINAISKYEASHKRFLHISNENVFVINAENLIIQCLFTNSTVNSLSSPPEKVMNTQINAETFYSWPIGMIFHFLMVGVFPYSNENLQQNIANIQKNGIRTKPFFQENDFVNLLKMLEIDQNKRCSFLETAKFFGFQFSQNEVSMNSQNQNLRNSVNFTFGNSQNSFSQNFDSNLGMSMHVPLSSQISNSQNKESKFASSFTPNFFSFNKSAAFNHEKTISKVKSAIERCRLFYLHTVKLGRQTKDSFDKFNIWKIIEFFICKRALQCYKQIYNTLVSVFVELEIEEEEFLAFKSTPEYSNLKTEVESELAFFKKCTFDMLDKNELEPVLAVLKGAEVEIGYIQNKINEDPDDDIIETFFITSYFYLRKSNEVFNNNNPLAKLDFAKFQCALKNCLILDQVPPLKENPFVKIEKLKEIVKSSDIKSINAYNLELEKAIELFKGQYQIQSQFNK